jgi:hypothetical protein
MPTIVFTRDQVATLLDVPPLFVNYPPVAANGDQAFSETAVCIVAIGRELLGALDPWEVCQVANHLWQWKPTSPWGWLVIYGDPVEIVHTTEQDAADLAVRCKGFRARLHLDPFLSAVLERLDDFRGNRATTGGWLR